MSKLLSPRHLVVSFWLILLSGIVPASATYSRNLVITEFLASNSNGLLDEDGTKQDWVELHNPTSADINLNGWYLTDNAADLKKWKFPAVTLPAKGYLVVFASDKNRKNPANPLHTNFKLSNDGEYLGLVKPDGVTVAWDYAPTFPEQLANISYGVTPLPGPATPLVIAGAAAQVLVPTSEPPPDWNQPGFNPGAEWTAAQTGVGFDRSPALLGGAKILYVAGIPANGVTPAGDQTVINRLTSVLGHEVTVIDDDAVVSANAAGMDLVLVSSTVTSGSVNTKLRDIAVPLINWERGLTDDFLLSSPGSAVNVQTDINITTFGEGHRLGGGLVAGPVTVRQTTGTFNATSSSNLAPGARVIATASTGEPAILMVEKGLLLRGNDPAPAERIHVFLNDEGLSALTPSGITLFDSWIAEGLKNFVAKSPYQRLIRTDLGAVMEGTASSALVRMTFTPDSVAEFESLILKMRYDDGFVVWLNGVEVARRNAPATLAWDSIATSHREVAAGLAAETIDLSHRLGLLVANSPNVLAIQGLNYSVSDENFLILPELTAFGEVTPYVQYYTTPTPGAPNNTSTLGLVPEVVFSAERGYFDEPFELVLADAMPQAQIRYTTDGSAPTATTGTVYSAPIRISTTAVIRAAAFRSGYSSNKPETRTYLHLAEILQQPASISGWPQPTIAVGTGSRVHDYEMDPDIVNDPETREDLIKGMTEIPTMSIVVTKADMWNAAGGAGFYRSDDVKKAASVEYINPADPEENVQADCSVEGHSHDRMKRSLRLSFTSAHGEPKFDSTLFTKSPLGLGKGNRAVDNIVLRAGNNHSFARSWNPTRSTYTEDEWYRDTQIAMGGPGSPGRFVHLFINGIYWGLYNPVERPDANFASDRLGGEKENWFSVNHGGAHGGDPTRFNYLTEELITKDMSDPATYEELCQYVDVQDFADYLICAWYIGLNDWPVNNWWGGMSNSPAGPFRFFCWDGEAGWGTGNSSNLTAWVHPAFRVPTADLTSPAARIWHAARMNPDFMALFADRVNKHLSEGGALSVAEATKRWDILNDHVKNAIMAESARWGDTMQEPPARRNVEWQQEVIRIRNLMSSGNIEGTGTSNNGNTLRNFMRGQGFYPALDAPTFSQEGGVVPEGYGVVIANPNPAGTIYYTVDGSDPRLPGGALNPAAMLYQGPVPIDYTLEVKARVRNGIVWSAVDARTFISDVLPPLRVTEIIYNPAQPTPTEMAEGFQDNEDFEFLEIRNFGAQGIDLSGATFASGLTFTFGERILRPGEAILLVHNAAAFTVRYGSGFNIAGSFEGSSLDNAGERIRLKSAAGATLIDFIYDDAWHPSANNEGHSLVALQPEGPPELWSTPGGWRPSSDPGGSPGTADPPPHGGGTGPLTFGQWRQTHFSGAQNANEEISGPDADYDSDGLGNLLEYAFGTDPQVPQTTPAAAFGGIVAARGEPSLKQSAGAYTVVYARRKGHTLAGLAIRPKFSVNLSSWEDALEEPTLLASDGEIEIMSVPFPAGGERRYFRVEVSQTP